MIEGWILGSAGNATIAVTYLAVATLLGINAIRTNQWRYNVLGVGTVLLYITCGGGHAVYALQFADFALGRATAAGNGAALLYAQAHMWTWDVMSAGVGVWYWTMRKRFANLVTGTAVYEDLRIRQMRALEVNDNLVQHIARAKLSLELDLDDEALEALRETREAGDRMVHELTTKGAT